MAVLFHDPRFRPLSTSGGVYPGAKLYSYQTGTTTDQNTYSDAALSVPNSNPIVADGNGLFGPIYLDESLPAYRFVLKDSSDNTIWPIDPYNPLIAPDAINLTQSDIGTILYPQTAAELAAGVTPTNYAYEPYNLLRYGAVGDNSTINNTAIANWKAATDQADAEGVIPDGTFKINADAELPKKVRCYGSITGAFYALYQQRQNGWVKGLKCVQFKLRGCYFCTVSDLFVTTTAVVDGYNSSYGTFWNVFDNWRIETSLTVDITNFSINQNIWRGGRIAYFYLTGTTGTYAGTEAHGNTLDGVDFTGGLGLVQDDSKMQVNYVRSCYFEGGANITGNFHLLGWHGDANGVPAISRNAHMFGATGVNSRLGRDFLALTVHNLAVGGNWDILDSAGKPPCLAHSGGASVSVNTDTTEPSGTRARYEASFSDALDAFVITLQPSGSDRFGLVVYYKSTADFVAVESNDGTGAISHSVTAVTVDSGNNWKMLRIGGPASKTATTTVTLYAYSGSGGAAKVMSIGGIFAGGERAVITPQRPTTRYRYGSATYDPGSLADGAGVTTTVSVTSAALGDFAKASFSLDLQGITLTAWVSATDVVSVRFQNESGGTIDLASGTLRVQTQQPYA